MNLVQAECGNIADLRFNQDQGCFSCAMDTGLRIYNVEPLREKMHLDASTVGSVAICEMLYRTNLLAVVGGGRKQKFAENAVLVWDDKRQKFVSEFTFSSPVKSVRFRRNRLYVAEKFQIHVFCCFPENPRKLCTYETGENENGLCEVSPFKSSEKQFLIYPGHYLGTIQIVEVHELDSASSAAPITIHAHKSAVACIAINHQGTQVATASKTGTLIRVFDTITKHQVIELRRGSDPAVLYCINFSSDSNFLCASSDKGTVHIFAVKDKHLNKRFPLSTNAAECFGSYVKSQWALATFKLTQECKSICAFGSNSSVYAICVDGTFQKYVYSNDGNCNRESYDVFLNLCDDDNF